VISLAVVLMLAIARDHPFMQGNKRTALVAAINLLERSGYVFDMPLDDPGFARAIEQVVAHEMSDGDFERTVRRWVVPARD
jgi:death-on-curing protein